MFKSLLSPAGRARLDFETAEINRMYALSDCLLAGEILKLARELQEPVRAAGWAPGDNVYDPVFIWQVIPEIAKRLGATVFRDDERTDPEITGAGNALLRLRAGYCIVNCGTVELRGSLLTHDTCNGNVVAFALDRLEAPGADDLIGKHIINIAQNRNVPSDGRWTPAMMRK